MIRSPMQLLYIFSASILVKAVKYHLLDKQYTYTESTQRCTEFSGNSSLLSGDTNVMNEAAIVQVMSENQLKSVWVSIEKRRMKQWMWVDNSVPDRQVLTDNGFWEADDTIRCSIMDMDTRTLRPHECFDKHICYICNLTDAGCGGNRPIRCIKDKRHPYVQSVHYPSESWFNARRQCRLTGGDLAKIEDKVLIKDIVKQISFVIPDKPLIASTCTAFYIGLRKDHWIKLDRSGEATSISDLKWLEKQPSKEICVELVLTDKNTTGLRTHPCTERSNVLCMYWHAAVRETNENVKKEYCLKEKSHIKELKKGQILGMGIPIPALILIIIIIASICGYLYHRCKNN